MRLIIDEKEKQIKQLQKREVNALEREKEVRNELVDSRKTTILRKLEDEIKTRMVSKKTSSEVDNFPGDCHTALRPIQNNSQHLGRNDSNV